MKYSLLLSACVPVANHHFITGHFITKCNQVVVEVSAESTYPAVKHRSRKQH